MKKPLVLIVVLVGLVGLVFAGIVCGDAGKDSSLTRTREIVTFHDPNLEVALRRALEQPEGPIYADALATLKELHTTDGRGIVSLVGLEYCVNLENLDLRGNQIVDLSPVSSLTSLTLLYASDNRITDISPLSSLRNLEVLHLQQNLIANISALSDLPNLRALYLNGNPVADITPLVENLGIGYGDTLMLEELPLDDTSANVYIPELKARGVQVKWWAPAPPPTGIGKPVTIPDPALEERLRYALDKPEGNLLTSDLEALTFLDAHGIANLSGLEYCINLRELMLPVTDVDDLSPISGLSNLLYLWIQGPSSELDNYSPLSGLSSLDWLEVEGTWVGQEQLMPVVPELSTLTYLSLVGCGLTDISHLSSLTGLLRLDLEGNYIANVSGLGSLTNLIYLGLSYNQIGDISVLSGLTGLRELRLDHNNVSDISPLVDNPALGEGDRIDLRENPLSKQSKNEYIPRLEARGVEVLWGDY